MKANSPLGIVDVPEGMRMFGFDDYVEIEASEKINPQFERHGKEVLWYRGGDGRARTRLTLEPLQKKYSYYCDCGYYLNSGYDIDSIRCHKCNQLMEKSQEGTSGKDK